MVAERRGYDAIKSLLNNSLVQRAMALGSMPWNRSKVMLVGDGRVGKTALCNSMMGKPFVETQSTVGLTKLTCQVQRAASTSDGRLVEHTKPDREFEAGLAQLVRNMESLGPAGNEPSHQTNNNSKHHTGYETVSILSTNDGPRNLDLDYACNPQVAKTIHFAEEKDDGIKLASSGVNLNDSAPKIVPNVSLVMNYVTGARLSESDTILSIFDFGGQSVFNIIHHLFLTSYGVYLVVFNMLDILDNEKGKQSLDELSSWINSIWMHTSRSNTAGSKPMAPVFLVGTHKDKIPNYVKHEQISGVIKRRFMRHDGWRSVIENDDLCFFPVNNKINQEKSMLRLLQALLCFKSSRYDNVISNLVLQIENTVKQTGFVKEPRPLTWLRALDELFATKKSFLPYNEASSIAMANGVEESAIHLFISFLNEMGVVLWVDEEGLRDVVILDIITFFVEPATLIICNHVCKFSDNTVHHKEIQEICEKNRAIEWNEMTQRGLVSRHLLKFLLAHQVDESSIPVIINIMLKYGLIVKLEQAQDRIGNSNQPDAECYLVPALLPSAPTMIPDDIWRHVKNFNSCYFVFSTSPNLINLPIISRLQLVTDFFLPKGLMDRLIGKAVQWSQLTHIANVHYETQLYQNYAVLSYGRQQFRLVCIPELNCIRSDIEGDHPLPVYSRVLEQIKICIEECMGSLLFMTALRHGTSSESETGFSVINLNFREVQFTGFARIAAGDTLISPQYFSSSFGPWIINSDPLPFYDVFISHRQHKDDDKIIGQLNDTFLGYVTGSENRAVRVFYDEVRLKDGQQFQKAFGNALINSTIVVTILCTSALQRMLTHDKLSEDNVLIEWMLALECIQDPIHSKVRRIYPLMFGERKEDGSVGNLFDEGVIARLPDVIPVASTKVTRRLLKENHVNVSSSLASRTVRGIVQEISKYLGLKGWEYPDGFIRKASEALMKQLDGLGR